MIKVILSEGYLNASFKFRSIRAAEEFIEMALDNHIEIEEPLKVEIVNIEKSVPEGGNPVMAHSKESI